MLFKLINDKFIDTNDDLYSELKQNSSYPITQKIWDEFRKSENYNSDKDYVIQSTDMGVFISEVVPIEIPSVRHLKKGDGIIPLSL